MDKKYSNLEELILKNIDTPEPRKTLELIEKSKEVKVNGFLSMEQFYEIVMWKSSRPRKHYLNNSEKEIFETSKRALSSESEKDKIEILISLNGVSIAVASALLTIINPKEYGVIDIRVWQLLYLYGEVRTKPSGKGFKVEDWLEYLSILRRYAKRLEVSVRHIERVLFFHHREIQEGLLY